MSDTTNYCMECERLVRERDALFLERQDEADRAECAEAERDNLRKRADYLNNAFNKKCDELFGLKSVIRAAGCTCNDYAAISPHACDCPLPELALDAAEHAVLRHMLAATQGDAADLRAELEAVRRDRDMLREQCQRDHDHALRAEAERDECHRVADERGDRIIQLEIELERTRPVVEAAEALLGYMTAHHWATLVPAVIVPSMWTLRDAVDVYRAATSEPPTFCCGGDSKACMEHGPCSIEREARAASSEPDGNCPPNCNGEACHMTPPCKHANGRTSSTQQTHEETA